MTSKNADQDDRIGELDAWWTAEKEACRDQDVSLMRAAPWEDRVRRGYALDGLVFARREMPRGRSVAKRADVTLWFRRHDGEPLPRHRLKPGYPALMWAADANAAHQPSTDATLHRGVVARTNPREVSIRFAFDYDHVVESQVVAIARGASEVTFQRGHAALSAIASAEHTAKRTLLFADGAPRHEPGPDIEIRDEGLNTEQRLAVERATHTLDAALVHGPPGTGKTRVLVEVVRQALRQRQRVLVSAPSNVAVDNITRRLAATRVKVLRLGPADAIAPDLSDTTLRHKMQSQKAWLEAQELFDQAQAIADGKGRKLRDPRKRIGALRREAHVLRDQARADVMRRSRVVCATAGGVDAIPLGDETFDLVVLDEATQASDPVALSALVRGGRLVLAGDPHQLPPTIISQDPEAKSGLSSTLFERCSARWPAAATTLLTTQHRMSESLMRFPSTEHYDGQLVAHGQVKDTRLQDLVDDELGERDGRPWLFIDTSGLDEDEVFHAASTSFHNPASRRLISAEMKRLIALGLPHEDMAIICPYAEQVRRLRRELREHVEGGLEIGTVDAFQGREKEVVLVDLVRKNGAGEVGFLAETRRMNVALTRAKRQVILVGDAATLEHHPYYRRLIAAATRAGGIEQACARNADAPEPIG